MKEFSRAATLLCSQSITVSLLNYLFFHTVGLPHQSWSSWNIMICLWTLEVEWCVKKISYFSLETKSWINKQNPNSSNNNNITNTKLPPQALRPSPPPYCVRLPHCFSAPGWLVTLANFPSPCCSQKSQSQLSQQGKGLMPQRALFCCGDCHHACPLDCYVLWLQVQCVTLSKPFTLLGPWLLQWSYSSTCHLGEAEQVLLVVNY